jgi:Mg2+-importing ATPase
VLPFLPLTAGQVLLNNFLSDIPAVGIAGDRVDPELVEKPRRWDTAYIGRFMLKYGLLSSAFDAMTFVVLVVGFGADAATFRTGWFVESLFTELVIALVVRTLRPMWQSRPGSVLAWSTTAVAILAFSLPYMPFATVFGFVQLPPLMMAAIVGITVLYVCGAELLKTHERFARIRRAAAPAAEKHL